MDNHILRRVKIINIMASVQLDNLLILDNLPGSKTNYNIKSPGSFIWDTHTPEHKKCVVYPNIGKLMFFGRKSFSKLKADIAHYTDKISNSNISRIKIHTCSCLYKLNFANRIDIKRIFKLYPKAIYEPELCPAILIKFKSLTFMLYFTNKLIITGIQPTNVNVLKNICQFIKSLEETT